METRHHKHHRRSAPALATSPPALAASKSPAPALAIKRSDTAPVTLRGWLYKQGSDGLQLWKKRWFVLSEYCLFYYKGGWCVFKVNSLNTVGSRGLIRNYKNYNNNLYNYLQAIFSSRE